MIVIDLDDDNDMANPYNVDSRLYDIDDDFDEEDDEVYLSVWGTQQYIYSIYFDWILW